MSRLVLRVLPVFAAAGLLAACSAMPEWTKPSTWIDSATEKKEQKAAKPAEQKETTQTASPAATEVIDPLDDVTPKPKPAIETTSTKPTEFPNLAGQPAPRQPTSTESQRREIRDSLVADRDNAQHTADGLRGGTTPAAPPPAPAAATAGTDKEAPADKPKDE
jgi:hypothetical protein